MSPPIAVLEKPSWRATTMKMSTIPSKARFTQVNMSAHVRRNGRCQR